MLLIPFLQLDPGVVIVVYRTLILSLHPAPRKHGRRAP